MTAKCECHQCIKDNKLTYNNMPLDVTKMILCPECGNKRCPKASNHRLACTSSNDAGQHGSNYLFIYTDKQPNM